MSPDPLERAAAERNALHRAPGNRAAIEDALTAHSYPQHAVRAIADTSRADSSTEDRDLDAQCALDAIRVLPLAERAALTVWLLDAET